MTTTEVCRLLKITRPTLYHWIEEGRLTPWKKLGDGFTFLFLRSVLTRKLLKRYSRRSVYTAGGETDNKPQPPGSGGRETAKNNVSKATARILLISQDPVVVQQSCSDLQSQGYAVSIIGDFPRMETILKSGETPDIVVLDLDFTTPERPASGLNSKSRSEWHLFEKVKKLIQESHQPAPVYILLSGKHADPQDAAKAFKKGAWDFLKRPLASSVFMARVRLALRRRFWSELDTSHHSHVLASLDELITLDPNSRILKIRGVSKQPVSIRLTRKESEILCLFLKRPEMVFSKTLLLEVVWGYTVNIKTRTIDCHIKNLRQKLSPYDCRIETHYSLGYRFRNPPPAKS
ncbi:MAG: hypothetical protein A2270_08455 [Elusimicrobia bacterium RIFOXYA12_FULL_51_18]|nr:MAG: hypothetical protein A2270_08455 [Elusimicrobia bacterium RIFOXYA12_FULL_51_18]OGS28599.1 MAG: hypothetical protein A2218_02420 [Elusimicrobia bacterium RIFOXYA2_FULL_53_38]